MRAKADRVAGGRGSARSVLAGGLLGGILLAWLTLAFIAPGFAAVVAVFGSPAVACLVILRLLTLTPARDDAPAGRTLSDLEQDAALLRRVADASGGVCRDCGVAGQLVLRAVLPVGRAVAGVERRFVALCPGCDAKRERGGPTSHGERPTINSRARPDRSSPSIDGAPTMGSATSP